MHEQELYDIYDLWHVPFWQTLWFKIIFFSVLFLALIALIVWFVRRRRNRKKELSAGEQALHDLRALRERKLVCSEHAQEFYLRVTSILKTYLHHQYRLPVQAKTDQELLHFLYQEHFSPSLLQELQEIFSGMELIKFARASAVAEQLERDLQRSILFVERTISDEKIRNN